MTDHPEPTEAREFSAAELEYLKRFPIGDFVTGDFEWVRARSKWGRSVFDAVPHLISALEAAQADAEKWKVEASTAWQGQEAGSEWNWELKAENERLRTKLAGSQQSGESGRSVICWQAKQIKGRDAAIEMLEAELEIIRKRIAAAKEPLTRIESNWSGDYRNDAHLAICLLDGYADE